MYRTKRSDYVMIMGDWNAVVREGAAGKCIGKYGLGKRLKMHWKVWLGKERENVLGIMAWERQGKCIGKYALGKRNNRGEKLAKFCDRRELLMLNT